MPGQAGKVACSGDPASSAPCCARGMQALKGLSTAFANQRQLEALASEGGSAGAAGDGASRRQLLDTGMCACVCGRGRWRAPDCPHILRSTPKH